ncbi:MAG TPA: MATE family efflux transporter [Steroidobacteraceae bacterium]|jgi:MATE family multidrug resistance protein|nr:MATE family efflux transporter [Steroidobacteraceae bacterium]
MHAVMPPGSDAAALPARRLDAAGHAHVDQRAVLALALPLMANSAVQIVLNLTDMWFVGRISTIALAAVGAVQWLVLVVVFVLGGIGSAVQTIVAQAQGQRHYQRAAQAVWTALWGTLCAAPLFVAAGAARNLILAPFGFDAQIAHLAGAFWLPRVGGAFFGAAVWAMFGFFNGVGRPRATLLVTGVTAVANALFNQLFIFRLGWGIAGSGWATTLAQALGLALAVAIFLRADNRRRYQSHLSWRPRASLLREQLRLGIPMGLLPAADMLGFALFQMMQVRLGTVAGAATQVVMMLTSVAYLPGFGIALAGTTLVGQSIGAGDTQWARRVGTRVILLAAAYMGGTGVLLALAGPAILPLFTGAHDADAPATVALGTQLLWVAAGYHFFDGVNLGSVMCLRGAGDAVVPAALVIVMSWLLFAPLAHVLTFAPGQGWVPGLPQLGWGAIGGWTAVLIYIMVLGSTLFVRWRSRAWWRHRGSTTDRNLSKTIL